MSGYNPHVAAAIQRMHQRPNHHRGNPLGDETGGMGAPGGGGGLFSHSGPQPADKNTLAVIEQEKRDALDASQRQYEASGGNPTERNAVANGMAVPQSPMSRMESYQQTPPPDPNIDWARANVDTNNGAENTRMGGVYANPDTLAQAGQDATANASDALKARSMIGLGGTPTMMPGTMGNF